MALIFIVLVRISPFWSIFTMAVGKRFVFISQSNTMASVFLRFDFNFTTYSMLGSKEAQFISSSEGLLSIFLCSSFVTLKRGIVLKFVLTCLFLRSVTHWYWSRKSDRSSPSNIQIVNIDLVGPQVWKG